jgi:hypothetical protein
MSAPFANDDGTGVGVGVVLLPEFDLLHPVMIKIRRNKNSARSFFTTECCKVKLPNKGQLTKFIFNVLLNRKSS